MRLALLLLITMGVDLVDERIEEVEEVDQVDSHQLRSRYPQRDRRVLQSRLALFRSENTCLP